MHSLRILGVGESCVQLPPGASVELPVGGIDGRRQRIFMVQSGACQGYRTCCRLHGVQRTGHGHRQKNYQRREYQTRTNTIVALQSQPLVLYRQIDYLNMRQFSQKIVTNFGMNFTMRYSRQDFRREIPEDHALRRT